MSPIVEIIGVIAELMFTNVTNTVVVFVGMLCIIY